MEKMKLVSPWINFYREVEELFSGDTEVKVIFDDENYELKLYVQDPRKAEALEYILPQERLFGNVSVKIVIIPANKPIDNISDALKYAFKGNYIFNEVITLPTPFGTFNYAVFNPTIIQYKNDDISDLSGKRTTTAEQVAKEVLSLGDEWHICSDNLGCIRRYETF